MSKSNMYRSVNEEWLEKRRKEWSSYIGYTATKEIQDKFKIISGINENIINCNEDTPIQLWIDIMTDKLISEYEKIEIKDLTEISTILLVIGFNKEILEEHGVFRKDFGYHLMLDEIIEILIEFILTKI